MLIEIGGPHAFTQTVSLGAILLVSWSVVNGRRHKGLLLLLPRFTGTARRTAQRS